MYILPGFLNGRTLMRNPVETRSTLLETALQLIWQSNYSSVGVNEICSQAGVTKGAFYHHFQTKADLYCAASGHYWEGMKAELDRIFSPSNPPLSQLERLIEFVLERQRAGRDEQSGVVRPEVSGCPFFTAGGQAGNDEEKVRLVAIEMCEFGVRYNVALVRALKADGCLNGDPSSEQVGRLVYEFIQGLLIYGRILNRLDAVEKDLRDGIYRLLDLKHAHRSPSMPLTESVATAT
jgi:TetR/AcrR family transcriptional repressor of nem operon